MNRKLIRTLGKVVAAAGWADKRLTSEEIESMKDLLLHLQRSIIDPREDALFDMYIMSPVETAERERLIHELRETIWSEEDKAFAIASLKMMLEADGEMTAEEQVVWRQISEAITSVNTELFGDLGRLVRAAIGRRSQAVRDAPNREQYFEEFLQNKFYYEIRRRLNLGETELKLPEKDLRRLSIIGGLMARIAHTDEITLESETSKIISILESEWRLSHEAALFTMECAISKVSQDFDYLRIAREFIELTEPSERIRLLDLLFAVADADGRVSNEELLEITFIADYLLLSLDRVNKAFLKVSR